ncbi:MAG: efflux RND transporter permease subunit [Planctomycetota bacterium]|nr:efflux RND transporter permease subunit [Planctomycetota bacterium]
MSDDGLSGGVLALGVRRPVAMGMVVAAAVVFGFVALGKLKVDLLPPLQYPSLTVRTVYSGAAPEDVEERVTERLEDVLSTVGGLVRIRSSSRAEVSEVLMEFEWGTNLPFLVQDVRERLDRVFLPPGVDKPLILRYDPSLDPVLRLALSGGSDLVRLRDVAEFEIERRLEGLPGVAAVRVKGGLVDEVQVLLDPQRLASFGIGGEMIRQRLQEENLNVPGGTLQEGSFEYVVRTLNEFRTLADIEDLPILERDGRILKLRDLAVVKRSHRDRDLMLRVGSDEAVEVAIFREAGANLVEVARTVRERLWGPGASPESSDAAIQKSASEREAARLKAEEALAAGTAAKEGEGFGGKRPDWISVRLPSDVRLTLLSDQSVFVRSAIREVNQAAMLGGLLAVAVCFLFLGRFGPTLVIGLAVPISIVATFGAMLSADVSLNIMSLGGLALGIGMLVDSAIVVLESIEKCREEGDPPMLAAIRGVREVGGAVIASTLTTVAVFAPIVFVEGVAGQTFGDQALTVVASLTISLAVALFFVPGLAARLRPADSGPKAIAKKRLAALLPHLRGRRPLFRGLLLPLRPLPYILIIAFSVVACAAGLWLMRVYAPGLDDAWNPPQPPGAPPLPPDPTRDPVPDAVVGRMAVLSWVGLALSLPLAVVFGQIVLGFLGRIVSDLLGFAILLVEGVVAGALGVVWLVLWIPCWLFKWMVRLLSEHAYPFVLRGAIHLPLVVLLVAGGLSWGAWNSLSGLGKELLPEVLQGEMTAELFFPAGMPLPETDRNASRIEMALRELPGVAESAVSSGTDRETISTEETGPHTAQILLRLKTKEGADPRAAELELENQVRAILEREPALARYELRRPTLLALRAPLEVEVYGEDLEEIRRATRVVQDAMSGLEGVVDLRSSLRRGNPEVRIVLDREQLARHGLTVAEVSNRLRLAVEGEVSSTFPGRDERIDIRVRADTERLARVDQLRDLPVNPGNERPLPLGAVATFEIQDGPSDIRHIGGRRAATLSASLAGFDLGETAKRVEERLERVTLPPGTSAAMAGQTGEMRASLSSLSFALLLAVCLVYAVMAAQFESLLQPLLILCSVPLAGVGAAYALAYTHTPISVVVLLGAVILAGIVVNNAIVLVDRINRNRAKGMEVDEAILEGARARMRPILMTTVTTVLGMLPLTGWLGGSEGMELRAPMAMVVITGLVASTLLTLIVLPTLYRLLARSGLDQQSRRAQPQEVAGA